MNDKDQLGGVKGSKVKVPVFSPTLSALRPVHIAGGSKTLFIVSHDGKVRFAIITLITFIYLSVTWSFKWQNGEVYHCIFSIPKVTVV